MNKYEMMYIIDAALEDAPRKELIEKVSAQIAANGGVVEKVDEWGKRRLAYLINDEAEGYYVLYSFESEPEFPAELDRIYKITDGVLRSLIVKKEA